MSAPDRTTHLPPRYGRRVTDDYPDHVAAPNCTRCLVPMADKGDARELAVAGTSVVEGHAWWRCPVCGLDAIA